MSRSRKCPGFGDIPTLAVTTPVTGLLLTPPSRRRCRCSVDRLWRVVGWAATPGFVCRSLYIKHFLRKSSKTPTPCLCQLGRDA